MKVTIDPRRYHGTKLFGISTARRARVSIQEIVEDGGGIIIGLRKLDELVSGLKDALGLEDDV